MLAPRAHAEHLQFAFRLPAPRSNNTWRWMGRLSPQFCSVVEVALGAPGQVLALVALREPAAAGQVVEETVEPALFLALASARHIQPHRPVTVQRPRQWLRLPRFGGGRCCR